MRVNKLDQQVLDILGKRAKSKEVFRSGEMSVDGVYMELHPSGGRPAVAKSLQRLLKAERIKRNKLSGYYWLP